MHHRIIGIALELHVRELSNQEHAERVVHEQVCQHRRDRGPLRSSPVPPDQGAIRLP